MELRPGLYKVGTLHSNTLELVWHIRFGWKGIKMFNTEITNSLSTHYISCDCDVGKILLLACKMTGGGRFEIECRYTAS